MSPHIHALADSHAKMRCSTLSALTPDIHLWSTYKLCSHACPEHSSQIATASLGTAVAAIGAALLCWRRRILPIGLG